MLFLIEYDRAAGTPARIDEFPDTERSRADQARLERELGLRARGVVREVVLLEAPNLEALRVTHRRYFESLREFVENSAHHSALRFPESLEPARVREGDQKK